MAASFVGKWKPDTSNTADAAEFFAAFGQADAAKEYEGAIETEVTLNGNTLTFVTNIQGKSPRSDDVIIGGTTDTPLPNGVSMKGKHRLEGDRLISEYYVADNLATTLTRYVKGNELISDFSAGGKTFTFKATRI